MMRSTTLQNEQDISAKQRHLQCVVNRDIRLGPVEYFESHFALTLLKHLDLFASVKKISAAITQLMETNRDAYLHIMQQQQSIIHQELSAPYFGALYSANQPVTAETLFNDIYRVLQQKHGDFSSILQVHCIFYHRIHLKHCKEAEHRCKSGWSHPLFAHRHQDRIEREQHLQRPTTLPGLSAHTFFNRSLMNAHGPRTPHLRAKEKFQLNPSSNYSTLQNKHTIPMICGPSGHTMMLMTAASLYGNLTPEETKEYALAIFAFLASGGNHSFYEVMCVANLYGVNNAPDNYASAITPTIEQSQPYQALRTRFPHYLSSPPTLANAS